MSRKGPLFTVAGALALGIGLGATDAKAQLEDILDCEFYLATGDIGTLAAIAADETDSRRELAELCLAQFVQPAQGIFEPSENNDEPGIYPG
jgi:hypothetical protein